jgi:hypothetical protein
LVAFGAGACAGDGAWVGGDLWSCFMAGERLGGGAGGCVVGDSAVVGGRRGEKK